MSVRAVLALMLVLVFVAAQAVIVSPVVLLAFAPVLLLIKRPRNTQPTREPVVRFVPSRRLRRLAGRRDVVRRW